MNAQASILRVFLAGGLALGLSGCGYIEDLIEDETTNKPQNLTDWGTSDAGLYAKVGLGAVDLLTDGFGSGFETLAKANKAAAGFDCPVPDVTGFDPDTYDATTSKTAEVTVVNSYVDDVGDETCLDENDNPVSGTYTVTASGLDDETWPATLDEFLGFDWAADTAYATRYKFSNMLVTLDGPDITASNLNGTVDVDVTAADEHAVNVGAINTVFTTDVGAITVRLSDMDLTKTFGSPEDSTTGNLRVTVTLLGYVDITLTDIAVDTGTCANYPLSGTADFTAGGDTVSVLFLGTGAAADCSLADVTLADGTVLSSVALPPVI